MPLGAVATLKGEYCFTVLKRGVPVRATGFFPNLITNAGMDMLGGIGPSSWYTYLPVGTSTVAPQNTDTHLTNWMASAYSASPFVNVIDTTHRQLVLTKTWTFSEGQAVGVIREVGVGAVSNGQLFSKAALLDFRGIPSVFEVFADEQLQVTYRLRIQQPDDYTGVVNQHTFLVRPRLSAQPSGNGWSWLGTPIFAFGSVSGGYGVYSGGIGVHTSNPLGNGVFVSSASVVDPYVAGSYTRTATVTFGISYSLGVIKSLVWCCGPTSWQASLDPPLLHTNEDILTFKFSVSWARG